MATGAGDDLVAGLLARCRFPATGSEVTAAVSGGADSLALLVLARAAGCVVTVVHVDHGLRAGTAAEAEVVRDAATRYDASFHLLRLAVPPGPNVEARAREARYAALPPDVLTGHTLDDRAETMLLNLLRGAGPDGMAARLEHGALRPLLALRRSETRALCEGEGLAPVDDPSNADVRFVRNRIRAEVLPLLDDVAGRDVAPLLVRQARAFADDADLLDELAAALDPTDARALAAAPVALARRSVRAWLRAAGEGLPPDAASVERVLAVARGEVVATEIVGGGRVARRQGRLRIEQTR